jgi:general secretion pathway protein G
MVKRAAARVVGAAGRSGGWTLIELLVVISLIVVLAGLGLANYSTAVKRSREAVLKENLFQMRDSIDQYYADTGKYPPSLEDLASDGYLRAIPEDPFTGSATTWVTIPAEPDPNDPFTDLGIYDVKSGTDALALDGTPYSEW